MTIWLIAIVFLVVFGALGHVKGAIRMGVSFVGLVLATFLAVPLGPTIKPLFPLMGVTNPIYLWVLPPLTVFVLISLVFIGASLFVHRQVALWYKYKTDEGQRLRWERLVQRLGIGVGLLTGAYYTVLLSVLIYVGGYFTVQVTTDSSPGWLRFVSQARRDLQDTQFAKMAAAFDPASRTYYEVADLLGLIYNNPVLETRLTSYPPLLVLADRTEFQQIGDDTELNEKIKSQASIVEIANHPKVQAVLANQEILNYLLGLDLQDLRRYLETGKSELFEEEKILGRWRVDAWATLILQKRNKPDITASEMGRLKRLAINLFPNITLLATVDNKAILKVEMNEQTKQLIDSILNPTPSTPPAAIAQEQAAPGPVYDERFLQRYGPGLHGGASAPSFQPGQPPNQAAPPRPANPLVDLTLSAQGRWARAGDRYELRLENEQGKAETAAVTVEGDKLTITRGGHTLIFLRS
jgi:hypothetical protein